MQTDRQSKKGFPVDAYLYKHTNIHQCMNTANPLHTHVHTQSKYGLLTLLSSMFRLTSLIALSDPFCYPTDRSVGGSVGRPVSQ